MGLFNLWRGASASAHTGRIEPVISSIDAPPVQAMSTGHAKVFGPDDPRLLEIIREGGGVSPAVTPKQALRNTTVMRCVSLISFSIGMLPLHLQNKADKTKADDHPLFRVLHRKPNPWQTAYEFRSIMQQRALTHGDAFALIIRTGPKIVALIPLDPASVTVRQNADWSLTYFVTTPKGQKSFGQREVFHLRYGLSENGYTGLSLVRQGAEAIGLALQAEVASARIFKQGVMAGLTLEHPSKLTPEAYRRLQESLATREGAENAGRSVVLEEGMKLGTAANSARDSQTVEQRKMQIEEIARPFGVPRPLLGMDDTSWGSGIDVLGQMFVQYGLNPWFEAWQQAIERDLLTDAEADVYQAKFNPGGLLRGSLSAQMDFWTKALGSGGQHPIATPEEARESFDWQRIDRKELPAQLGSQKGGSHVAA
ncbi:phage portal protein [Pseudogemmobacter sp. CC-YST710]|uniref:Phage portal protein n=2 Tax=Pseudogemmobacter faecipullorum TaxID=2755041 RepID=A0ABS8CSU8_9RHOB|nr:phage portal protein [Pseudogemmobacter faecipullorum]